MYIQNRHFYCLYFAEILKMAQNYNRKPLSENYLLIAAIDLGTSHSGFAYANRRETDATVDIIHKRCWNNTSKNLDIMKTRTCILFKRDETFVAFGFTALQKFIDIQKEQTRREYMFFRDYKIHLYNSMVSIEDIALEFSFRNCVLAYMQCAYSLIC